MNREDFNSIVALFKQKNLNMHYLMISHRDKEFLYSFDNRNIASDIRSISKTVLTLIAGVVNRISNNKFNQNTYIYPIIKNSIDLKNQSNLPKLKQIQVKHLLTHTTGFNEVLLMREDIVDIDPFSYLDLLINTPLIYKPGSYYLYSNAGIYLLSAVLQEYLDKDLLSFADEHFFEILNINKYRWERYGKYLAGATRLWMFPDDLLKIGKLIMNKGCINGHQLINPKWIETMIEPHICMENHSNLKFYKRAYGYGIWIGAGKSYFAHGTDGQILLMIPESNSIIITQANEKNMKSIERTINEILTHSLFEY